MQTKIMKQCFGVAFFFLLFIFPFVVSAATSPIAHWKFDDGSGTAPVDSSGNNITGSFNGSTQPTWSTDVPSVSFSDPYSLSFTGTGDGVLFNWPASLNMNATDPRSFSFWFKPTAAGENSGNYSRLVSWTSDRFEIAGSDADYQNNKLSFYDGVNWRSTNYTLSLNTWYQITFTFDGSIERLFIAGTEQFATSTTNNALSGVLGIGTRVNNTPNNEGINGLIDDVRIYNTALSSSQISNLTNGSNDPDSAPDTTAPTISAIATSTSNASATITWTTNEAASTKIVYSVDTSYASSTTEADTSTRVTSHSQSISGLVSCATYNFKVSSADTAGNRATSTASTFTTTGCPGSASVSAATSSAITVSASSSVSLTDSSKTFQVSTPANFTATSSVVVMQLKSLSASTVLNSIGRPDGYSSAGSIVFNATALINNVTTLDTFASPLTITYTYTDADISGITESSLVLYRYSSGSWSQLSSCSVDTSANTVTCTTSGFSTFALFGTQTNTVIVGVPVGFIPNYLQPPIPTPAPVPPATVAAPTPPASSKCARYEFRRVLRFNMNGEDVRALQKFLNCAGFVLATSGPGSVGRETPNFSQRTLVALRRFQETYKKDVLTPIGALHPTGIFGNFSQQKAYGLMK